MMAERQTEKGKPVRGEGRNREQAVEVGKRAGPVRVHCGPLLLSVPGVLVIASLFCPRSPLPIFSLQVGGSSPGSPRTLVWTTGVTQEGALSVPGPPGLTACLARGYSPSKTRSPFGPECPS